MRLIMSSVLIDRTGRRTNAIMPAVRPSMSASWYSSCAWSAAAAAAVSDHLSEDRAFVDWLSQQRMSTHGHLGAEGTAIWPSCNGQQTNASEGRLSGSLP